MIVALFCLQSGLNYIEVLKENVENFEKTVNLLLMQ